MPHWAWTFIFQVINFGIVVFILYKLLYKPVRRIMQQRQDAIAKQMEDAKKLREQANALRAEYEQKLAGAEAEAEKQREALLEQAAQQAEQVTQEARGDAKKLREAAEASIRRDRERAAENLRGQIVATASALAGAMAGSADLSRLHEQAVSRIDRLLTELDDAAKQAAVAELARDNTTHITAAAELSDGQQHQLATLLGERLGVDSPRLEVKQDEALVAGLEVRIGGLVLKAHWRDRIESCLAGDRKPQASGQPAKGPQTGD